MNRLAKIYFRDQFAGMLMETDQGYEFIYEKSYILTSTSSPISRTLPLKEEPYKSNTLFPFFEGLIPEGWLLDIAEKNWKLHSKDRFGLLLACCEDCIGAVSVRKV